MRTNPVFSFLQLDVGAASAAIFIIPENRSPVPGPAPFDASRERAR